MTQQIVIDTPASLATAVPSAETLAYAGAWLIMGVTALIVFAALAALLTWLQTPSKPKAAKPIARSTETWLPKPLPREYQR